MTAQRADARRNYARILSVARDEVAEHGADASLEQIARTAGVGSATVRRHFPNRRALLQAVFHERIEALAVLADEGARREDVRAALLEWLAALCSYAASARGLASALTPDPAPDAASYAAPVPASLPEPDAAPVPASLPEPDAAPVAPEHLSACAARLAGAAGPLLRRAATEGVTARDVTVLDLLTLVSGIALATERHPDPAAASKRLLDLAVRGISPED